MIDEWKKGAKYWDHAWNPIIGCKPVSEGCQNCYAASMAERFPGLRDDNGGFEPHQSNLGKKPPKSGVVFVGNMTDLFGEWNRPDWIYCRLCELSSRAVNLILTKRADRLLKIGPIMTRNHIFIGITAENQDRYHERVKAIRDLSPYGVKCWLSAEPLLGPIDMQLQYIAPEDRPFDWIVVGAESGPNRRSCKLEWVESIVEQCKAAGIPVFVKQLEIDGKLVKDISKFPEDLQIRQVPWRGEGK